MAHVWAGSCGDRWRCSDCQAVADVCGTVQHWYRDNGIATVSRVMKRAELRGEYDIHNSAAQLDFEDQHGRRVIPRKSAKTKEQYLQAYEDNLNAFDVRFLRSVGIQC